LGRQECDGIRGHSRDGLVGQRTIAVGVRHHRDVAAYDNTAEDRETAEQRRQRSIVVGDGDMVGVRHIGCSENAGPGLRRGERVARVRDVGVDIGGHDACSVCVLRLGCRAIAAALMAAIFRHARGGALGQERSAVGMKAKGDRCVRYNSVPLPFVLRLKTGVLSVARYTRYGHRYG
jgi:hypothetical protein